MIECVGDFVIQPRGYQGVQDLYKADEIDIRVLGCTGHGRTIRGQLTGKFEHIGQHQHQPQGSSKGGTQCAGGKGAMQGTCNTAR